MRDTRAMTGPRRAVRCIAGALVVLSLVAVTGCGDDDTASTSSGTAAETTATRNGSSELQANLEARYEGTFKPIPTSSPPPKPGVNLWVISLNEASPGVRIATESIVDASKVLGWKTRVVDTKGAPPAATAGIKQAIADKADVIVLNVIECGVVEAAVKKAKAAGIIMAGTTAADCDAPNVGHEALLDVVAGFHELAEFHVDWALAQLNGEPGKILTLSQTDYDGLVVHDKEFADGIKEACPDCEVVRVPFVYSDLNQQLKGKVQAGLVKNRDAKMMLFPYDATLALGGAAGIQGSGRVGELKVMGGECSAASVDLIHSGVVTACVGNPYGWLGWQLTDNVNRLLNDEPLAEASAGQQLVDKEHNQPPKGQDYDGPGIDYAAEFKKIWNAAK